uniref:HTH CENPB-type domain-containing protein n=1 Tax=Graphocephala atropunctata TaxID=36148 RepID=A0A1B6M632_9HEMI
MAEKRKKTVVTMEEKLRAIKRLDMGESAKKIAAEMGVGTSTVSDWKKSRKAIENWCLTQPSSSGITSSKMMKKGTLDKVNEALYLWFTKCRAKGVPMSGPILQEKAIQFNKEMDNDSEFKASEGWLEKWKKRYGVRKLEITGEKLSANPEDVKKFKSFLHELLEKKQITGDQLFNCDESGLNFKMLPSSTLASKHEDSAPGYKKKKERVTILACSNVTGTLKLPLCVIGKSQKPRAFKNFKDASSLPVWYRAQRSAWMNSLIFKEWFFKQFVPAVEKFCHANKLPRKAILLLDNAPTHPSADELKSDEIKCVFLPPNVTSLCQPMDQGVLESLKRTYRRKLLTVLIAGIDAGKDVKESLKNINMLDVVIWVAKAWEEIKPLTLVRSWRKLLDHKASDKWECEVAEDAEDKGESALLPNDADNMEFIHLLENIPGCEKMNNDELNNWLQGDEVEEITDSDIIEMVTSDPTVPDTNSDDESKGILSHGEAFNAIEQLIDYVEHQEEATAADVMLFRKWRDITSKKRVQRAKQSTITSFFKKD